MRIGNGATSLFLAEGRVIISGNIVPEVWPADHDRLVVWLFKNSNARLCEYFHHDDIDRAFSMGLQIPKHSDDAHDEAEEKNIALVFEEFHILNAGED